MSPQTPHLATGMAMGRLDGGVALVTGGASGLGRAIAARLAAEGAAGVISDLQRELGEQTAASLGVTFLAQDVTSEEQWPQTLQQVSELAGPVSILVNNAGIAGAADRVSPEDTRFADWKQIFTVNLDSVFLGCRAGIAAMRHTGGGSIVNMSSIAALLATPDSTAYGAAKAAVRQLISQSPSTARPSGSRSGATRCTPARSPLRSGTAISRRRPRSAACQPSSSCARPRPGCRSAPCRSRRTSPRASRSCSDDARFITGSELIIDGGLIHCDTFSPSEH